MNHIADAGEKVESQRTCGTCKWFQSMGSKTFREGFCNYPLPPLPISVPYSSAIEREWVEPHYEDCPVWENRNE
jgi:hypothetical protein